jgi:uncharacterized membrane protein YfcA
VDQAFLLAALFFGTAILYSSVGHAGASGYLAGMALVGLPQAVMKPTALVLNLLVASVVTVRFHRARLIEWRTLAPFMVGSVPLAFVGGGITLPGSVYRVLVGIVLILAAARLLQTALQAASAVSDAPAATATPPATDDEPASRRRHPVVAVGVGGVIGLLAGLTGTGGGIFLTPVLVLSGWVSVRAAAGMSAAFILVNSAAGLAGNVASVQSVPAAVPLWGLAVLAGGFIGSGLGSRRLGTPVMRGLLALVLLVAGGKLILVG